MGKTPRKFRARLIGSALAAVMLLGACQSDPVESTAPGQEVGEPVAGGVLNVGVDVDPAGNFDIHVSGADATVGSGPFKLTGYVAGQSITLEKNPDYAWGPSDSENTGAAHLDGIEFRILPENTVRSGALSSGELHVADNVATTDIDQLRADDSLTVEGVAAPGLPYSIFLNHSRGVFQDQAVRNAFQRGIDISSGTQAVFSGHYDRAWSILTSTSAPNYDESLEDSWPHDPELANSLLDKAGWTDRDSEGYRTKDGERLSAEWLFLGGREDRAAFADAFQADLKEIGFELVTTQDDMGTALERLYSGDYDAIDWSFVRSDGDILRLHLQSDLAPVQNASFVDDPQVDEWVTAAAASTDPAERAEIYKEVQNWAIETAAFIPVYVPTHYVAASADVHGIVADAASWPRFHNAWISNQ